MKYKRKQKIYDLNAMTTVESFNEIACKAFYGTYKKPHTNKFYFTNFLSDTEEGMNELKNLVHLNKKRCLISAPTGSGKTYGFVLDVFNEDCTNHDPNVIDIKALLVPTRSQSEQAAQEYKILKSIVGDKENYRGIDFTKNKKYVLVYDKVSDMIAAIEYAKATSKKIHVTLVIDECHTLTSAKYRGEALDTVLDLENMILEDSGTVFYVTATPIMMAWQQFDEFLFFEKINNKPMFDSLNLYVNTNKRKTKDFIKDVVTPKEKGFLRINDKDMQKLLQAELSDNGFKTYIVNGDEKQYYTDENGNVIYENEFLNSVINMSLLIDSNFTITTGILDAGQNLKGVGNKQNKDKYYCAYFCITGIQDLNIVDSYQFANRIRYHVDSYNIIYNNVDIYNKNRQIVKDFKDLESMFSCVMFYLKTDLECARDVANREKKKLQLQGRYDKYDFAKERNEKLHYKNILTDRDDTYGDSVEFKDNDFIIHFNYLFNYIFIQYMKQLFYHFDKFVEQLEKIFHIKVNVINNVPSASLKNAETVQQSKQKLLDLSQDDDFINHYYDTKYKEYTNNRFFKEATYFMRTGIPLKEAIKMSCTLSEIQITKKKNDCTYEFIQNKFDYQHYSKLKKIFNGEIKFIDLKQSDIKDEIGTVLLNESYVNKLKSMLKIGIPFENALKVKPIDVSKYIEQYTVIENNIRYLHDQQSLNTTSGNAQYTILNYVIQDLGFNLNGSNRIKITKDRINTLITLIDKDVKTTCSEKQILKMLKQIFEVWNTNKNKNWYLDLISLKLKH